MKSQRHEASRDRSVSPAGGCATTAPIDRQDIGPKRAAMVAQIRDVMIRVDPKVDDAFLVRAFASVSAVPRKAFVVPAARSIAYLDVPLVIDFGQTISAPHIVTLMRAAAHVSPPTRSSISGRSRVTKPQSSRIWSAT